MYITVRLALRQVTLVHYNADVIYHTRNTERKVENTTRCGVLLTSIEEFRNGAKHFVECLIYLLDQN